MVKDRFDLQVGNYNSLFYILIFFKLMSCLLIVLHTSLPLSTRIIWVDVLLCVFFFLCAFLSKSSYIKINPEGLLLSLLGAAFSPSVV